MAAIHLPPPWLHASQDSRSGSPPSTAGSSRAHANGSLSARAGPSATTRSGTLSRPRSSESCSQHATRNQRNGDADRRGRIRGRRACAPRTAAAYEENGAAYGRVALVETAAESEALAKTREFVRHVEGGGQVKAVVRRVPSENEFLVALDASLESERYDSARPLFLHWGIHRSDCSSWFMLDPADAPPETIFVQDGEAEAMRTPLPAPPKVLKFASANEQVKEAVNLSLALKFSADLAPFSLDFVLYQPPAAGHLERYIGSTGSTNFSVPVGMLAGEPQPLGATRLEDGSVNFALYSKHAQGVVLCLYEAFAAQPSMEIDLEPSSHRTGDVWHVRLLDAGAYAKYGYRCKGDSSWDEGDRFHTRNVLLDPYAKTLAMPVEGQDELPSPALVLGALPPVAPSEFDWQEDYPPRVPTEELVIYRLNVGAFTIDVASGVPNPERGTFLGVARKASYLHSLGVNAVLLQPIAAFDEAQGSYFPFNFFAPMPAYGVGGDPSMAARDLKYMVRELHKWGIEVLAEVVVSHTAEQSDQDPKCISFRGIDNKTYYITDAGGGQVIPSFGAQNAFNCNDPVAHTMIVDALSHWVTEYHIDGFSFTNASALLTGPHGQPVARPLLMEALSFEPILASAKLIADQCSPITGACQVDLLPHWWRWMELNSRFCSDVRRFLRGDPGQLSAMATRVAGSGDLFSSGRGPSFSLNYVTSFVGLTLADLVSYSLDSENSWSCGADGPSADPVISSTRLRQLRNLVCALFLSLGVPVLVAGDEYGATKGGMLHLQDWEGVFLWASLESELAKQVSGFLASLARIRRRHRSLERREFWFAGDITWHGVRAWEQPAWDDPNSSFLAYSVRIRAADEEERQGYASEGAPGSALYVAFNAQQSAVQLDLPEPPAQCRWCRIIDTSEDHPNEISAVPLHTSSYTLSHFSVLALEARRIEAVRLGEA